MRGRIVALNGVSVSKIRPPEDPPWVLDGDRGITYADAVPEAPGCRRAVVGCGGGRRHLVSFEADLARCSDSRSATPSPSTCSGGTTATIFNLRKVEWRNSASTS